MKWPLKSRALTTQPPWVTSPWSQTFSISRLPAPLVDQASSTTGQRSFSCNHSSMSSRVPLLTTPTISSFSVLAVPAVIGVFHTVGVVFDDRTSFDGAKNPLMPVAGTLVAVGAVLLGAALVHEGDTVAPEVVVERIGPRSLRLRAGPHLVELPL